MSSFLWLSIFHCIYVPQLLYPFICRWKSRLFPCSSYCKKERKEVKSLSHVRLFVTPRTIACQAPPSMEISRQDYWSALPFPSPGDLPDPGIKSRSPALQADSLLSEPPGKPPSGKFLDLLRGDNFCHRYSYIQVWRLPCELPDPCNSFLSLATG